MTLRAKSLSTLIIPQKKYFKTKIRINLIFDKVFKKRS